MGKMVLGLMAAVLSVFTFDASARFASVDPVQANSNNGQNFNRYHYANNNPYKFTDPDGRQTIPLANRIGTDDPQIQQSFLMNQGELMVSVLTGTDAGAVAPSGSGAVQSAVTPVEFLLAGGLVRTGAALQGGAKIADSALVVRGGSATGANSVEGIAKGTGTHPSGVTGFSAESANGATLCQLCSNVTHNQVGVTTAGEIRAAGGNVVSTKGVSPTHATVTGLKPEAANRLLTPTRPNPIPPAERLKRP